ncbi:MAG: serine protease [Tenuifilaceae bacterium]|jgi:membrane protein implicated in regulation of membrane protease activity|nr:serine protease [Tenuifilaceae bacterium]
MILLNFNSWWDGLSTMQMIYWIITVPASLVFVIQLVMTFLGSDADGDGLDAIGDADLSVESDSGVGFQFISLKNFIAFFTVFGWAGLACISGELPNWATLLISTISGVVMMLIMASIYYFMGKLTETGTLNMRAAIGKTATVYLFIPQKRQATGKIQLKLQGYRTLDAMTDEDEVIPTGAIVQVVDILNDEILLVKRS